MPEGANLTLIKKLIVSNHQCIMGEFDDNNRKIHKETCAKITELSRDAMKSTTNLKRLLNLHLKEKYTPTLSKIIRLRSLCIAYTKHLITYIRSKLDMSKHQFGDIRYVLSLEQEIIDSLHIRSKIELAKFIEENEIFGSKSKPDTRSHRRTKLKPNSVKNNTQKVFGVVDQGEKFIWDMCQERILETPSYYVHAHIKSTYIYFKLNQVVKINGGTQTHDKVFIKDRMVKTMDMYKQVAEMLWTYFNSLDDNEKEWFVCSESDLFSCNVDEFKLFNEGLTRFFKKEASTSYDRANGALTFLP